MRKLQLEINGKAIEVDAEKIHGTLWFHYAGKTLSYKPESALGSGGSRGADSLDPTQVVAPMPGKIIKVFKGVGDLVLPGETVVAMEAMKMEYNLKTTQTMKVTEVLVQAGDNVSQGQKLVGLEEEA